MNPQAPILFTPDQVLAALPLVDCHMHTSWTDGDHGVAEMFEQACRNGLTHIVFTEHVGPASSVWFPDFARSVRALPESPCRAFVGMEGGVKNFRGGLAVESAVRSLCDVVVASVHRFPGPNGEPLPFEAVAPERAMEMEFELSLALLASRQTDILGHPMGMSTRMYGLRPPISLYSSLAREAARNGVAFEINARYHPDPMALLEVCRETGARVTLGSDAHRTADVGAVVRLLKERLAHGNH